MKYLALLLVVLSVFPLVSAAIDIESPEKIPVLVVGSDKEYVSYEITLTNRGPSADFQLYSLIGVELSPATVYLEKDAPTSITVTAKPVKRLLNNARGFVEFEYELFNTLQGVTKGKLLMDLITLEDALYAHPLSVEVGDEEATFTIQNVKNAQFDNLRLIFSSDLFETEERVTLKPFEMRNLSLALDRDRAKRLVAGTYPLKITAEYEGAEGTLNSNVKYVEQGGVSVAESSQGVVIRTKVTEKVNEGNLPVTVTISEKRDIFTRLLTSHTPAPETVSKQGFYVAYTWQKSLAPSEKLRVESKTNYTLPLVVLMGIVLLVVALRWYLKTGLRLVKRVSFVRTRGGEFALKVTLHAKSHTALSNVVITDRVPHAMKLYESFGIKPHAIDEGTRTLTWNLAHLNAGEERVFSYIIYSKLRVVGSFELPLAHARYTHKGKSESVFSNKTSFAAELTHTRD